MKKLFKLLEKKKKHRRIIISRLPHPDYPKGSYLDYYAYVRSKAPAAAGPPPTVEKNMIGATMRALTLSNSTTYYYNFEQSGALQTVENQCWVYVPVAATLKNFYCYVITNSLNGNLVTTVRKNGANTSITTTHGAAATGVQSDLANTQAFAQGDYMTVKFDTTAAGAGTCKVGSISIEFDV